MKPNTWTNEDVENLREWWGNKSIPAIAQNLGRSVNAIKVKAQRVGLSRHLHSGRMITFNQFIKAIGYNGGYTYTLERFKKSGLRIHHKKSVNKSFAMIDIDEFWKWAEHHKQYIDFSRIEKNILGKEPEWVDETRRADFKSRRSTKPWSQSEDEKLKADLLTFRYTYAQLSERLNRSEGAIKRRISTLGLRERPIRETDRLWKDWEVQTLTTMFDAGYSYDEIGKKLCRSGLAVRGKHERILKPDMSKRAYRNRREKMKEKNNE